MNKATMFIYWTEGSAGLQYLRSGKKMRWTSTFFFTDTFWITVQGDQHNSFPEVRQQRLEFRKREHRELGGRAMERKVLYGIKAPELCTGLPWSLILNMKFGMCRKRCELTKNYQGALRWTSVRAYRVELLFQSARVESSCCTPKHSRKTPEDSGFGNGTTLELDYFKITPTKCKSQP